MEYSYFVTEFVLRGSLGISCKLSLQHFDAAQQSVLVHECLQCYLIGVSKHPSIHPFLTFQFPSVASCVAVTIP